MIFGIKSILVPLPVYVIWYFLFYYLGGHGTMPLSGIVIIGLTITINAIFFFDIFIVDQGYLVIKFLLNPFKKNLKIRLADITGIELKTVGVKLMRTGININVVDNKPISFLINFTDGELIRFMNRIRAEGIEIVHVNMQDEVW